MKIYRSILLVMNIVIVAVGLTAAWMLADEATYRCLSAYLILAAGIWNFGYYVYFRKRFIRFTEDVCRYTDKILCGEGNTGLYNQETLTSKMVTELEKMEDILSSRARKSEEEKVEIQKTISEISHQLKTPIANIRMYEDMLLEPDVEKVDADRFREIIGGQLSKLEFLLNSLMKTSRLEGEMVKLQTENISIFQTLAAAVNGVVQKAERKRIEISVDCRPTITVNHDVKWTTEAIENILDNAVKYTQQGGRIVIQAVSGEMYTEIRITDNGRGIDPCHLNDIFKRFYREKSVSKTEGLGLGLYLARHIITLQGGYILAKSVLGQGSCFSIFLPNGKRA